MASVQSPSDIREAVLEKYGQAARSVLQGSQASCCGDGSSAAASCCGGGSTASPIIIGNYNPEETRSLPAEAVLASLGCGNPTALAELRPGEVVLDLGSGGGIDVLLSARRVGPTGFAYGLDMTDEMLALAERNRVASGVENVTFLRGQIEAIPLPDASVDVIISNCVINLSVDKDAVLREAFRVLRPGGRFAVSDIVIQGELAPEIKSSMEAWAGCIAGALEEQDYIARLNRAGFADASVEVTKVYDTAEALGECLPAELAGSSAASGRIVSGFVRATKPASTS
ncbi:MAG: arsenite S-adenosylmethyltransferase [Chloroflexi bacterium]|nr:MAG: arsenite S-adenosylmethyltransferase [Chloroflexota bacterium]